MKRHLTATAFVVEGGRTLLHWHKGIQQWLPPGGHMEPNEDPVQAALREVREETGILTEIIRTADALPFEDPKQLPPPFTILVEDIPGPDEPHQHIDFIYFVRPVEGADRETVEDPTLRWVTVAELTANEPLDVTGCGISVRIVDDVRQLALIAINTARSP